MNIKGHALLTKEELRLASFLEIEAMLLRLETTPPEEAKMGLKDLPFAPGPG